MHLPGILLEEELGRGAYSVVYRARRAGAPCAVKIGRADQRTARWFRREGAALARVRHPGLPVVLEVGEAGGVPFLAMELVEGQTLAERLAQGPMEEAEAIELARALASTLDAVHRRGLVHRDVKPRNIVLEPGGRVRLVDFGFATLAHVPREAAGTRAYAAPEQLRVPAVVDGRADLYALGRVIYECVAGARWPEPPRDPERDLSPPLAAVVAGLVVPELEHRYRSAAALLADLARVGAGELPRGPGGDASDPEPLAFVARGAELAHLVSAFDEVRRGWGAVLLVRGERGAGKSRLLRELARAVAGEPRGARVLYVRCELDDPAPLAALRATLASLAGSLALEEASELRAALGPELAAFASALSSELAARLGVSPAAPRVGADAFSELAAELIARAAGRLGPVLLCVDDAQWIDPISAEVLARLSQRLRGLPILVAAATRAEAGAAVFGAGEQLRAIALSPFDEQAAGALAAAYLGAPPPPGLVPWMVRVADGTPLGLADVLDAMLDAGVLLPHDGEWRFDREVAERMQLPRGTLALLERRIGELPEATRRVFEAAAVIGRSFDHDLLAAVVGVGREDLGFAIAEARRNGLVEAAEGGVHRFVHDCVREALLSGLDGDARRAVHQRVAEALDAAGISDAYALATHYAAGLPERDLARVLEVCHAATARALEAFDHEAALRFVEMARASAERAGGELGPRLLMDAGEAELRLGAHAEAIARFEAALGGTRDPLARATILGRMAWAHQMRSDAEEAWRALERAFAELGEAMPVERPGSVGRTTLGWVESRLRAPPAPRTGAARERIELLCELHYQNARLGLENGRPLRLLQSTLRARFPCASGPDRARPSHAWRRCTESSPASWGAARRERCTSRAAAAWRRTSATRPSAPTARSSPPSRRASRATSTPPSSTCASSSASSGTGSRPTSSASTCSTRTGSRWCAGARARRGPGSRSPSSGWRGKGAYPPGLSSSRSRPAPPTPRSTRRTARRPSAARCARPSMPPRR